VTAIAHDPEQLRELDAGTRLAWKSYSDQLRGLRGDEYERMERECWAELQSELRRLERRRQTLSCISA
jgi:hypothetical protein